MDKIPFEERIPEIKRELERRRNKWTLSTLDYDDVIQIIISHIYVKYNTFNAKKGEFSHWVNRTISNQTKNLLRNHLTSFSRPCIQKCNFNLGGDDCSFTSSGKQCAECPLYAKWEKKKKDHFNVKQTVSLCNHEQEVNNLPNDFSDLDGAKLIIDQKMKIRLNEDEYRIYKLLYIENIEPEQVGKILKYKKAKNSDIPGYQMLLKLKKKFIKIAKEIIKEEIV